MIKVGSIEIPNKAEELTIKQYDAISLITNDSSLDKIEAWVTKFVYLGASEDEIDEMTIDEFKECVKAFNDSVTPKEKVNQITVNGDVYNLAKIGVGALSKIEKHWRIAPRNLTSYILAVLFEKEGLTKNEHKSEAHIKHKAKIFEDLRSDIAIPFVVEILKQLTTTVEKQVNEVE